MKFKFKSAVVTTNAEEEDLISFLNQKGKLKIEGGEEKLNPHAYIIRHIKKVKRSVYAKKSTRCILFQVEAEIPLKEC